MSVGDLTFLEPQVLLSYKGMVELLVFWSIWIYVIGILCSQKR